MVFTLDFPDKELLEFRLTENRALIGHVTDTECRRTSLPPSVVTGQRMESPTGHAPNSPGKRRHKERLNNSRNFLLALPPVGVT